MTIHRLFSKDPNDEKENVTHKTIFTRGYVTGCLFAAVYVLILLHLGLEHPLTKYVSITAISLIIMAASVSLTYHMIIIIMVPIIIAGMYTSKQLSDGNVVCLCIQHCKSGNPKITEKCDEDGRKGSDG